MELHSRQWDTDEKSPVLMGEGVDFEYRQLDALDEATYEFIGPAESDWDGYDRTIGDDRSIPESAVADLLREAGTRGPEDDVMVVHQPSLSGEIGAYDVSGTADLVFLTAEQDSIRVLLAELKNSDERKVPHSYQAAAYASLVNQVATDVGVECSLDRIFATVITQQNDFRGGMGSVEDFDYSRYLGKLRLKLSPGNEFDQILDAEFDMTRNRIDRRCSGCEYESVCMTRAAESKGLELLGFDPSTQDALEGIEIDGGITDLEDFALLFDQPGSDSSHTDAGALTPRNHELVEAVREQTDLTNLQMRSQIAYHFLTELDADYGSDPDLWGHHLQGSGYNLPRDEHGRSYPGGADYPSGALIRIYLFVQHDPALDRVTLLNAYVENSRSDEGRDVSQIIDAIHTDPDDKDYQERQLLREFFAQLGEAIAQVAPDLRSEGLAESEGFPHLYFYSYHQRQSLLAALRRHPDVHGSEAVRTLLGLRPGIDQEMVSVLQQDFRERYAFRFAGLGLLQTTAQYMRNTSDQWTDDSGWFQWIATREDGEEVDLTTLFERGLFDGLVGHGNPSGGIELDHAVSRNVDPDSHNLASWAYPVSNREADQIPLEYIWGIHNELDPDVSDDPDLVRDYLYRSATHSERITEEDVTLLAQQFSYAIRHIERSTWNKDAFVDKEPLRTGSFRDIHFRPRSLADAVREYQQLEFWSEQNRLESYYRQPLIERAASGEAVIFENTRPRIDRNDSGFDDAYIDGDLLRYNREPYDPEHHDSIAPNPLSVDEWCVLTQLTDTGEIPEEVYQDNPIYIERHPTTIVDDVDLDSGTIEGSVLGDWPQGDTADEMYCVEHQDWMTADDHDPSDWGVSLEESLSGDPLEYVLDPSVDMIPQSRAATALEPGRIDENVVYQRLAQVFNGDREDLSVAGPDPDALEPFIDLIRELDDNPDSEDDADVDEECAVPGPNEDQHGFITDTNSGVMLLQGPPGTGKTKFTLAPTLLSRVHHATTVETSDSRFVGLISALSHDAVDEALRSVAELHADLDTEFDDLDIVRICSSEGQGVDLDSVEHIHYSDDDAADRLEELYDSYINDEADEQTDQLIMAGTPASLYRAIDKMAEYAEDSDGETVMSNGDARYADMILVDEASMMDLPLYLLVGAFLRQDGQIGLVGDHRQMEPIQQHEWEREDRRPIELNTPFLSALNFHRFLRGEIDPDTLEHIRREPPDLENEDDTIPLHQLTYTYRLPDEPAQMHTDLVYQQDGIELTSCANHPPFPTPQGDVPEPLEPVFEPETRISLLEHTDSTAEKRSPIEQSLIEEIVSHYDVVDEHSDTTDPENEITVGVVVPFNRQKEALNTSDEVPEEVKVDTVEKFQGRERDLIIVAATSTDPSYINRLADFLFDPNRFNVAASRMMRKVIVIGGKGLFQASSQSTDDFDDHSLWLDFYGHMGGFGHSEAIDLGDVIDIGRYEEIIAETFVRPTDDPDVFVRDGYDSEFEFEEIL
ncbi:MULTISPECIES: AAA domain-containing protein [Haloarcula]|uniref:AAA domain-containing protein n=1 Tax=Haloarcula TaxID=2237 RepID=UPI0023ECBF2B|nr:AAA domain-containing protein [Halomicroarcula sp. XH51]